MKAIFFALFFFTTLPCLSQDEKKTYQTSDFINLVDGKAIYSGIVHIDSASATILYARAKQWIYTTFKSGKDVIEIDDKEGQKINGKGLLAVVWKIPLSTSKVPVFFKFSIAAKDNRYRYEFSDIYLQTYVQKEHIEEWGYNGKVYIREGNRNLMKDIDTSFKGLATSLEKQMKVKGKDEDF